MIKRCDVYFDQRFLMMLTDGRAHPSSHACDYIFFIVSLLAWNAKGIGGSLKCSHISHFMRSLKVDLLVITQTKCKKVSFPLICQLWGMGLVEIILLVWEAF